MANKITIGLVILTVIVVAFIFLRGSLTGSVINENEEIKISLSEISDKTSFYEYNGIKYFAVKAQDGRIKTAFDACEVCYSSNKGYSQDGNVMVCNNCGNKYPIAGLGTENLMGGGCWPGYLPSKIKGEYLIIKESDLEKGAYRFK